MKRSASPLGSALVDGQGRVSAKLTAPEDFGEVHDIYAVIDGRDAARGGFRILRSATLSHRPKARWEHRSR